MSNSTETVMQFTEEHVNKRFQAYRFLDCDIRENKTKARLKSINSKDPTVSITR